MTKPTYEQALKSTMQWRSEHNGVNILLSFHGYIDPKERQEKGYDSYGHGIWCYYLLLDERMFEKSDWKKLCFKPKKTEYGLNYDYHRFPDVNFHGGITFYEVDEHYDHKTSKTFKSVKAGCDYNHLWDHEGGYSDNYDSVLYDAQRSVFRLLKQFPNINRCCKYSGIWDKSDNFYVAKNETLVHVSQIQKLKADNWETWLPKEAA